MKINTVNLTLKAAVVIALTTTVGCSNQSTENTADQDAVATDTLAVEVEEVEPVTIWVVSEDKINDISLVSKPEEKPADSAAKPAEKTTAKPAADKKAAPANDAKVVTSEALKTSLVKADYEPTTISVTEAIVPLDETQTLVSYNAKGKYQDAVQVVSDGDGNVNQIVFANKRHKDVYNVENGMTAKQVKELRKDMKHMMKHGKVFLYNDSSNVMYMLDAQDSEGNEVTEAEIDNMSVSAIVWKDKKHHKKEKM